MIGRIQTAPHPHGAAASGEGRLFFTTVKGEHTLLVFDTATDKLLKKVKPSGLPPLASPAAFVGPSASW